MYNQGEEVCISNHNCLYGSENHYRYNNYYDYGTQFQMEDILITKYEVPVNSLWLRRDTSFI